MIEIQSVFIQLPEEAMGWPPGLRSDCVTVGYQHDSFFDRRFIQFRKTHGNAKDLAIYSAVQ
jgi:hypothetical protein